MILVLIPIAEIIELKTLYEQIDNNTGEATTNGTGGINIFKIDDIHFPPNRKLNY